MAKKPELILPAADMNKTKYAFMYGADAVYGGLPHYPFEKNWAPAHRSFNGGRIAQKRKKFHITLGI